MDRYILAQRYARAGSAMARAGIDLWVSLGREQTVLSEPAFLFLMPAEVIQRAALILTAQGERICVCGYLDEEEMTDSGLFTSVIGYSGAREFEPALAAVLALHRTAARLALNISELEPSSDGLSHSDYLLLARVLAAAGFAGEIVPSVPIMKCVRGKKSREEADKIEHAVRAAMGVYEEARPQMRLGLSGEDVQRLFQGIIDRRGYGYSWEARNNPYVSIGPRSSYLCRHPPRDVRIEPGDVVNVDLGIRIDGFSSDNQRTFYALRPGESGPPEEVVRAFTALQRMNREVCAAMKTGVDSASLTAIGDRIMIECGYPSGWKGGYGHEIGLFAHHGGLTAGLNAAKAALDCTLEENMTFTLEPAILTPYGRVCQEEVVCVGDLGGAMFGAPQAEIWLI